MWKITSLGESCKMYQPQTISKKKMNDNGKYFVYGANGIIGKYDKYNHSEPQLLVTCRGATCGSVNISQPFSWINGNAMVIQPDTNILSLNYMEHLFRGGISLSKAITGSAQPQITRQSLSSIKFAYPSLTEQHQIVTKLDAVFTEIDNSVLIKKSKLSNLKNIEKKIIYKLILNHGTDFIKRPLHSLFNLSSGKFLPRKKMNLNGKIKVYGGNGVAGHHDNYNLENENILIGRVGAYCGNVNYTNERIWLTDNCLYINSYQYDFDKKFLSMLLSSLNLRAYAHQAAQPAISYSSLKDVELIFPKSIHEQTIIFKKYIELKNNFKNLNNNYESQKISFKKLRFSILNKEILNKTA